MTASVSVMDASTTATGTFTATWTVDVSVAGQFTLNVTPSSSLTPILMNATLQVQSVNSGTNVITFV